MKSSISVDVIIPAYNAHEKIIGALSSLSIQKINFPLNVIIVNDGSIHNYKDEISFFKDYLNIKEITLKKNSGVGVAKQTGIDNSNGDYILFLDSDDSLYDSHSLQSLYNLVFDGKCDYAYGATIFEFGPYKNIFKNHDGCLHGKIFSRKLIENNNNKFNTTRTSEDNSFNHLCLFNAKDIRNTEQIVYIYKDNGSSLTKGISISKEVDNLNDYAENVKYTLNNVKDKFRKDIIEYYLNCSFYLSREYKRILKIDKKEAKRVDNILNDLKEFTSFYTDDILDKMAPDLAMKKLNN